MKIRPIEISDYEQIRRIGQQCIDLHKLNRPDDFTDTEFMNESDFQKFIPSENKYCYLIEDTEIMGFILTEYYPDLKRVYIGDLVVDENISVGVWLKVV